MTSSSWVLDMVPPMWTKTACSWKREARESILRSDIQRHFALERLMISCSTFVLLTVGVLPFFCCAEAHCGLVTKKHSPRIDTFIQALTCLRSSSMAFIFQSSHLRAD